MKRKSECETSDALVRRLEWAEREALREALDRHPLVAMSSVRLQPSEFVELAARLGRVALEPRLNFRLPGHPEIMIVGNVRDEHGNSVGANALRQGFHSDRSFHEHPAEFTLLYALEVPALGGDTEFSSLSRLYDELDEDTRAEWSQLAVEHEATSRYFEARPDRRAVHPLVRQHPDSGARLVYASPPYARNVIGVSAARSKTILQRIADSLEPPDYVHRWQPGDLLIWDNRAVVHRATAFDVSESRRLWRASARREASPSERHG